MEPLEELENLLATASQSTSQSEASASSLSALRSNQEDSSPTGLRRRRDSEDSADSNESKDSSIIMPTLLHVGAAINWMTRLVKKKKRTSGFQSAIFQNPFTYNMILDFYGPEKFRKTFRMSPPTFERLVDQVYDLLDRRYVSATQYRRATIPPDIRLAITLRLLSGASYLDLCLAYQVKISTVSEIFISTFEALNKLLRLEGLPKTDIALEDLAKGFQSSRFESSPIFGCMGALDGICIKIKKPASCENPATFFSRKKFYALPVQALCDSNYMFRYCSAICTGATHDALAYAVCGLKKDIDSGILGIKFYIVGDEAYVCRDELLVPFPGGNADFDQSNFNFFLSSMRIHIEQAFGMLVARWRILRGGLEFDVKTSAGIVCLLMKLHNFCLLFEGPGSEKKEMTVEEREELDVEVAAWYTESNDIAEEFRSRTVVTTRSAVQRQRSVHAKRDALVAIIREKNRRRPNPVPLRVNERA